jgi:hypothetical protein
MGLVEVKAEWEFAAELDLAVGFDFAVEADSVVGTAVSLQLGGSARQSTAAGAGALPVEEPAENAAAL